MPRARNTIDYIPPILKGITELIAICNADDIEIDVLWSDIDVAYRDVHITTGSITTIERWEGIMGIAPKVSDTLEDRRFRILARINPKLPYTWLNLQALLDVLVGVGNYELIRDVAAKHLSLRIGLSSKSMQQTIAELIEDVSPQNMTIFIDLLYNAYEDLRPYTHGMLRSKTHEQLRSDPLEFAENTYVFSFDEQGGSEVPDQYIEEGGTATRPPDPTKSSGLI